MPADAESTAETRRAALDGAALLRAVDPRGFEPLTFSLRTRRATNCAKGPGAVVEDSTRRRRGHRLAPAPRIVADPDREGRHGRPIPHPALPRRPRRRRRAGRRFRITVLTTGLVRIEWAEDGAFEDRASTFALHRDLPVPEFRVVNGAEVLEIISDRVHLTYDRRRPSASGLKVDSSGASPPGTAPGGSVTRTRACTAPPARSTSSTAVRRSVPASSPRAASRCSTTPRRSCSPTTAGSPHARQASVRPVRLRLRARLHAARWTRFYAVSGDRRCCRGGRWATGGAGTTGTPPTSTSTLLDRFDREGVPVQRRRDRHGLAPGRVRAARVRQRLDRVQLGAGAVPRPGGLPRRAARRGLRVTLNVHPADGVRAFEDAYGAMCRALGHDPAERLPIAFDITDPAFLEAYFDVLHHGLEDAGRRLLVARLAAGPLLARRGHRPALDAEPLPLPRQRDGRGAGRSRSRATRGPAATGTRSGSPATR